MSDTVPATEHDPARDELRRVVDELPPEDIEQARALLARLRLRRLVDELPPEDLPRARELLVRLRLERTLANAPEVDPEPGELEAIREAEAEDAAHPEERRTSDELRRELGL